ncbi:methanogen homoaconitase small subunit [Methanomicrobium sp. W14]|uniref:LeuD/DmdB family oxidoreductase small subunit n=1 Tax=Methanomicrobium sp. W14 TaxID=2817839 RepID=UPI001AE5FC3C|nr:3-isopropylmalate dehydratase [Methanomicrobium sp. W14]MBP2134077.1 methanogen homoaconitase small subunit [Methanomicrobium sp. W14]
MKLSGHAVVIGEDVDTDMIIAGRYLRTKDRSVWAEHAFEDYDKTIAGKLKGSVIIAGKNVGCGSSREQAAAALKEAGVVAIVSPSFARIFFRNCVNLGLYVFETEVRNCKDGDFVTLDTGVPCAEVNGVFYGAKPLSKRMNDILNAGGLAEYLGEKQK